eukprot:XP_001709203.1 Hypothetical protein GL50803_117288 [Giardia lamblia ATCC 50803]
MMGMVIIHLALPFSQPSGDTSLATCPEVLHNNSKMALSLFKLP